MHDPVDPQWITGDSATVLAAIPADSVDLIVTSPPYFALRSYTDGGEHYDGQIGSEATPRAFLEALWTVTAECKRVLKPSGSMWVNLGDKYSGGKSLMGLPWRYAIGCIDNLGLILRAEVVWSKPNGLPESVTDRVRRSHEQWFHFTKEPRYFAAVDEVREPQQNNGRVQQSKGAAVASDGTRHRQFAKTPETYNPLGKLPGSVWTIPSEPLKVPDWLGVDHFAAFPQEWPRRIILGWSPSGICLECGEGRRPVVDVDRSACDSSRTQRMMDGYAAGTGRTNHGTGGSTLANEADKVLRRITGYACACPTPTAPTRPAVVLDPFGGSGTTPRVACRLGRLGLGIDRSADYRRLAEWRCAGTWSDTVNHGLVWVDMVGDTWVATDPSGDAIRRSTRPDRLKRMLGETRTGAVQLRSVDTFDLSGAGVEER